MRIFLSLALSVMAAGPAFATAPANVPEMSAGAAITAIALIAGAVAIFKERNKRK